MKPTGFMSEHSTEYALVPNFIAQVAGRFPHVIPMYFWSTREGAQIANESMGGGNVSGQLQFMQDVQKFFTAINVKSLSRSTLTCLMLLLKDSSLGFLCSLASPSLPAYLTSPLGCHVVGSILDQLRRKKTIMSFSFLYRTNRQCPISTRAFPVRSRVSKSSML